MAKDTFICTCCGESVPVEQRTIFDGQELCSHCLDHETVLCTSCRERIWRDDNAGSDAVPLCNSCFERSYTNCIRCGALIHNEDARYHRDDVDEEEPMCYDCYSRRSTNRSIQDYYYKPRPIFYGEGKRFFGVELEIDGGGEDSDNAREILNIGNADGEMIYCKHDGSLDEGIEIVTHPMTLEFHRNEMPWQKILRKSVSMGYTSHQAGTCGLHIHISRAAFGDTEREQDACIAPVLYFFEKHWEELLKFSRRTQRQLDRWAAHYGYKEQPKDILDHAKKGYGLGRYTCVKLQNEDTIEIRIFRGTLKYNTLLATLQLVDRICDVALYLSDEELKNMSWTTFVSGCQEPELVQYLKERRLYINEPVESEVEL